MFLFLDLETTGLDTKHCRIIEVACVFTDDKLKALEAGFERVIYQNLSVGWEEVARKMHEKNHLVEEIVQGLDERYVVKDLREYLDKHGDGNPIHLAGSSVHFDHAFIDAQWPELSKYFSHRHLDVSSLRLAAQTLSLPAYKQKPAHRAMADVLQSLDEARHYIGFMKKS